MPLLIQDPDRSIRLTVGCTAVIALATTAVVTHGSIGLGIAAAVLVLVLAIDVNHRVGLPAMWPLAIVALLQPWNGLRVLPFVAIGDVGLVALAFIVVPLIGRARVYEPLMVTFIGMLVVTAGGTLGMIEAQDPGGLAGMAKFVFGAPLVLVVLMILGPTYQQCLLLLTSYAVGAAVSGIVASVEPVDPTFGRSDGWGAHAGELALSGILGFFVFVGWALHLRHPALRLLAATGALLCAYSVVLSGTRSAVLGMVAGLLFIAATARLRGLTLIAVGALSTITFLKFVVPFLPYRNNIDRAFGTGELASVTQRTNELHADLFHDVMRLLGEHPWTGVGFSEGQVAHNLVLQTASLGGVVAVLGLILMWTPMAFLTVGHLNAGWSSGEAMRICTLAGVVGYFVFAQFQPLIWDRHLWFVVTLTVLLHVRSRNRGRALSAAGISTGVDHEPAVRIG